MGVLGRCWRAPGPRLAAPLVLLVAVAGTPAHRAVAYGAGRHGLGLEVALDTRPGIRVSHPLEKTYLLINRTGADLYDIRVTDPGLPGVRIGCPCPPIPPTTPSPSPVLPTSGVPVPPSPVLPTSGVPVPPSPVLPTSGV
ncbi:hypothetical protein ACWD4N_46570, partial [Streptomyces sp. NPDC002586]